MLSGSGKHRGDEPSETDSVVAGDLTGSRFSCWTTCAQRLAPV